MIWSAGLGNWVYAIALWANREATIIVGSAILIPTGLFALVVMTMVVFSPGGPSGGTSDASDPR